MKSDTSRDQNIPVEETLGLEGFAARANFAVALFEERGAPRPTPTWLAKRATSFLPHGRIGQPSVWKWLTGRGWPDTPLKRWAFAMALGVDAGWLEFGNRSLAPAPTASRPPLESPAPAPPLPRSRKTERRRA
jgi:hypothetical protein